MAALHLGILSPKDEVLATLFSSRELENFLNDSNSQILIIGLNEKVCRFKFNCEKSLTISITEEIVETGKHD